MSEKTGRRAHVTLYTKPGCHLCEDLKRELARAGGRDLYTLAEVNIETDPALVRRYGWEIPVVVIDGVVAFKYRLTAAEFREALTAARSVRGTRPK